jgi:hypothetical protein
MLRTNGFMDTGNRRCQRMLRPKNPAHPNCDAGRFGAVTRFGDILLIGSKI